VAVWAASLTVSSRVGAPFTAAKWYVLTAAALGGVFLHAAVRLPPGTSSFTRAHAAAVAALAAVSAANVVTHGLAWSTEPALARITFVAVAVCAFAVFHRNGDDTRLIARALAVPLTIVVTIGLAQVTGLTLAWGLEPLFGLVGGDGQSATFGNVNMAAQFVGFAAAFLIAHAVRDPAPRHPSTVLAAAVLVAASVAYIVSVGARSALLALAAAVIVTAWLRPRAGRGRWRTRSVIAAAGVIIAALAVAAASSAFTSPLKAESVRLRARLWAQTVKLIADHPLGVGSGNFVHAFLPYQLADDRLRSETVVYASPHNEVLRALAEEGIVWCALAAYLLFRLGAAVRTRVRAGGGPGPPVVIAAGASFLAVECLFQFPFALAFGTLAAALTLGLALSYAETADAARTPTHRPWWIPRLAAFALASLAAVALARVVLSDYWTATTPGDAARQARACALNPRNFRACLNAAWLDASGGHRRRARQRLAAILDRSPYYSPAIALLADDAFAQGDARAGCFYTWIYDALFAGRSSRHDVLIARCPPPLVEGFAREVRVPGYERFPMTVPAAGP
jgi:hypothetical protein